MRKSIIVIFTVIAALLMCTSVFAADIKITSAEQLDTGKVKVVCAVVGAEDIMTLCVVSYESNADIASIKQIDDAALKKIIYIDQFESAVSDMGTVEFVFDPAAWISPAKTYVVKVGGTGVSMPDTMVIVKDPNGGFEFFYGDADGDNWITASDAAYVLQNVLIESIDMPIKNLTANWFKYIDVDGDNNITAYDATEILQKSLVESHKMPVEEQ